MKKRDLTYSKEQMMSMNLTFGQFDHSMNFYFGFDYLPVDFDILNNPYVQMGARELIFREGFEVR